MYAENRPHGRIVRTNPEETRENLICTMKRLWNKEEEEVKSGINQS